MGLFGKIVESVLRREETTFQLGGEASGDPLAKMYEEMQQAVREDVAASRVKAATAKMNRQPRNSKRMGFLEWLDQTGEFGIEPEVLKDYQKKLQIQDLNDDITLAIERSGQPVIDVTATEIDPKRQTGATRRIAPEIMDRLPKPPTIQMKGFQTDRNGKKGF